MYLLHPSGNSHLAEFHELTPHENSILHMIMQGYSIEDIAKSKGIKPTTAKLHREHIREKPQPASIRETAALILGLKADP